MNNFLAGLFYTFLLNSRVSSKNLKRCNTFRVESALTLPNLQLKRFLVVKQGLFNYMLGKVRALSTRKVLHLFKFFKLTTECFTYLGEGGEL